MPLALRRKEVQIDKIKCKDQFKRCRLAVILFLILFAPGNDHIHTVLHVGEIKPWKTSSILWWLRQRETEGQPIETQVYSRMEAERWYTQC